MTFTSSRDPEPLNGTNLKPRVKKVWGKWHSTPIAPQTGMDDSSCSSNAQNMDYIQKTDLDNEHLIWRCDVSTVNECPPPKHTQRDTAHSFVKHGGWDVVLVSGFQVIYPRVWLWSSKTSAEINMSDVFVWIFFPWWTQTGSQFSAFYPCSNVPLGHGWIGAVIQTYLKCSFGLHFPVPARIYLTRILTLGVPVPNLEHQR